MPLLGNGVLIDVSVGPSARIRELLWRQNKPVPPAVSGTFLIDTGSDTTMVSEQLMRTLGIRPKGTARVVTSTTNTDGEPCNVYDVALTLLPHVVQPRSWRAIEALARPLLNQGIDGLLGRDLLAHLVLTYDGPRKTAHLVY